LKRLKNPKREDYFEREIQACESLNHPNILKVIQHGRTPRGKPFLITEYCDGGSLEENRPLFKAPGDGLRFFQQIVEGVAYAHEHKPPICHLDLKPENILLKDGTPVVGDFGICYIEDDQITLTNEGPRGSLYYCAPELRNPKISGEIRLTAADVYSLGKILYWLFTGDVYDGHEEEYTNDATRHLAQRVSSYPQFALVDELIAATVRRNAGDRFANSRSLLEQVRKAVDRIEAGGRVLDLRIPQRCLYCAVGFYHTVHDKFNPGQPSFPDLERRRKHSRPLSRETFTRA
jgi:serine/threonine protein kinase